MQDRHFCFSQIGSACRTFFVNSTNSLVLAVFVELDKSLHVFVVGTYQARGMDLWNGGRDAIRAQGEASFLCRGGFVQVAEEAGGW